MLIYRVTRAPERRIFKIFVGNIDEKDVPAYVNKIADNFKRSPVIDQQTGHQMATGLSVTRQDTGAPLSYNKENLLNPYFLVQSYGR